jgi:hypothetical protein
MPRTHPTASHLRLWIAAAAVALLLAPVAAQARPTSAAPSGGGPAPTVLAPTVLAPTAAAAARQRTQLTVQLSSDVATRGETGVVVRGRLAQGSARRLVLQVRRGDRWVNQRRTTTNRDGRYRMPLDTSSYGTFRHRVVVPVTARQRAAGLSRRVSAVRTFQVVRPRSGGGGGELQRPSSAAGDPKDFSYITKTRARWNPCSPITYRVNTEHGPAGALRDAKGAVERVEAATGLDLEYVGATRIVPQDSGADSYPADTQIVIAWASKSQSDLITDKGVAGVGGPMGWGGTVDEDGNDILTWRRGTVVLNSAYNGVLAGGFGDGTTVGKLLMHEISHVVGLGHAAGDTQVMYPALQRQHPTAWGAGDLSGLRSQGAEQGCIYEKDGSSPSFRRAGVSVVSQVSTDAVTTSHRH